MTSGSELLEILPCRRTGVVVHGITEIGCVGGGSFSMGRRVEISASFGANRQFGHWGGVVSDSDSHIIGDRAEITDVTEKVVGGIFSCGGKTFVDKPYKIWPHRYNQS